MYRSGSGYTLVEMLVVVGIILMVAAILLPVYETATRRAERVVCLSNLRNIARAALMYADDYDGRLVPALVPYYRRGYAVCWDVLLEPYLRTPQIYLCPSDVAPTPGPAWAYSCQHSYGINLDVTLVGGFWGHAMLYSQVEKPETVILFFDMARAASYGYSYSWGALREWVGARHAGGANYVTCAGNARWARLDADWALAEHWIP